MYSTVVEKCMCGACNVVFKNDVSIKGTRHCTVLLHRVELFGMFIPAFRSTRGHTNNDDDNKQFERLKRANFRVVGEYNRG